MIRAAFIILSILPAAAMAEPLPLPDGFAAAFQARDFVIAAAIIRPEADACEAEKPVDDRCVHLFLGAALLDLTLAESVGGRDGEASRTVPRAVDYLRHHAGDDAESLGVAGQMLGRLRLVERRYAEAEDAFRAAHAAYSRATPRDVQAIASALSNIASAIAFQGRESEATPLYREVLALIRSQQPVEPAALLTALSSYATNLDAQGLHGAAEPLFREALKLATAEYGEGGAGTARYLSNLAVNLDRLKRLPEGEALHRRALAIRIEAGDIGPIQTARINLAYNLHDQHRYAEAEAEALEPYALASGREASDPVRIDATRQLGMIWSWMPARQAGARTLLRAALSGALAQAMERPGFDTEARFRLTAAQPAVRRSVAVAWTLAHR